MKIAELKLEIEIPKDVEIDIINSLLKIKGHKGQLERKFVCSTIKLFKEENKIVMVSKKATKRDKKMINTFRAHIRNMIKGVTSGYTYKLKICSGHFPMSVSVEKDNIIIKNLYGEKIPKKIKIPPNIEAKVENDTITINGLDKEIVGQTAGLIEQITRRPGFDKRIFQAGIFLIERDGKPISK